MKTVILYGELARRFGKYHRLAVKNAAEAIRALKANFKDFESFMCSAHQHGMGFRIFVGGESVRDYGEIHNPAGKSEVIRLVPVVMGAKSPFVKILIGAALIGAAIVLAPVTGGTSAMILGSLGASMVIGGVAQLLTSPPDLKLGSQGDQRTSYVFSGAENTAVQGKAVPVGYGRMIVGSCVISAGINTHET